MSLEKRLSATVKIIDFPSRNNIISFLKMYIREKETDGEEPQKYEIYNRPSEISINFYDSEFAYKFMEQFIKETIGNPMYERMECWLTLKPQLRSTSNHTLKSKFSNISSRYLNKQKLPPLKSSRSSHNNSIGPGNYDKKHWADIKNRAGLINNDTPYQETQSLEYKNRELEKKKWISKSNFNIFVGKATANKKDEIKNYFDLAPTFQPKFNQEFREITKKKWINKQGFLLY